MVSMKTGCTVTAILLLLASVWLALAHRSESPLKFDAEVWKHRQDNNERLRMVSDLKPKLMGASKSAVQNLLGTPITNVGLYRGDYYYYVLGTQERFGDTDGLWLCLKFKNDLVDSLQIAHD